MISQYRESILAGDLINLTRIKAQICPHKIYRYRSFDAHWYSSIIKGKAYMGSPAKFNDPFDGNLYGYAHSFYNELLNSTGDLPSEDFQVMSANGEIKTFSEALKHRQNAFKDCFRVACFTERLDLMTLWAHYASNHTGYVIEYDTTRMTREQRDILYKIAYFSNEELQNIALSIPRRPIFNLLQKDLEWSYEQEWRMVKMSDSYDYEDLSKSISAVYLGIDFKKHLYQDEIKVIQEHLQKNGAELREMYISNAENTLRSRVVSL